MARTANAARKQVNKAPTPEDTAKEPANKVQESQKKFPVPEKKPAKSLSVSVPTIGQKPKPTPKKVSSNILKEIKYYQSNIGFLIPRALIVRIVRQVLLSTLKIRSGDNFKFTAVSLNVIHEAIENHIVCLLELSYMAARHAKRVTLFPTDIRLINRIRGASAQ
ncbi:uncharacterized protein VICG_00741 [Vittaforma corneae ATCC 50505]|uniref:Core Histone H2A/H2B/H3 domain-containing protein n=1 Tax=Vittaforma corneae (strain ATCC 50505) TaxID=993615 RepID=L2GNP8_VITCO|nr:uncharacterized protein VICG_00741 [Vittaforma corneae ATCC 50505]ELA42100.1 hypothetical protein VICG_00741 [Vittaforma corneae ATCC 50505]